MQKVKKFTEIGNNSSIILLSLVEDILDLAKIEAGTFSVQLSHFKVSDLIHSVHQIFEFQGKHKGIEFKLDIEERVQNMTVKSDEGRLKQVLLNFLSNAFKFTFVGGITISVVLIESNEETLLEFGISDTGMGIKDEEKPKLFTLFSMLESTKKINPNGCGLGLTVSKKYVDKLNGTIWITSKFGEGTKASFRVPVEIIDSADSPADSRISICDSGADNSAFLEFKDPRHSQQVPGNPVELASRNISWK